MFANNRYFQLLTQNRAVENRQFSVVKNEAATDTTVYLYDVIVEDEWEAEYWGGITADQFISAVNDIETDDIHLRINSPGGSVFAANSMAQALVEHKATIHVHIDGIAASAASRIAMVGDDIVIAQGASIMIHKAWTIALGNADEFIKAAERLDKLDDSLARIYESRTNNDAETVKTWMKEETWFFDEEAIEFGFADSIAATPNRANTKNAINWNLNAFLNMVNHPKAKNKVDTDTDIDDNTNELHQETAVTRLRLLNLKTCADAQ